jgi:hypothetical protein
MIEENKVPINERFLTIDSYFLEETIDEIKAYLFAGHVRVIYQEGHDKFINWQPNSREIALLSMYAYADFEIPRAFNIIFELNNPDNFIEVDFTITQAIFNGWAAVDSVGHGNKHVIIVRFEAKISDFLNQLMPFDKHRYQLNSRFAFCKKDDFLTISNSIKFQKWDPSV